MEQIFQKTVQTKMYFTATLQKLLRASLKITLSQVGFIPGHSFTARNFIKYVLYLDEHAKIMQLHYEHCPVLSRENREAKTPLLRPSVPAWHDGNLIFEQACAAALARAADVK